MKTAYREWIGKRLTFFRNKQGMDQRAFAGLIGKTRQTYAAYEEGRAEPAIFTLKQICDIHKITIDQFLEDAPTELSPAC